MLGEGIFVAPIAGFVSRGILVMSRTGAIAPPHRPIFGRH